MHNHKQNYSFLYFKPYVLRAADEKKNVSELNGSKQYQNEFSS
jgi:hypothetical protein